MRKEWLRPIHDTSLRSVPNVVAQLLPLSPIEGSLSDADSASVANITQAEDLPPIPEEPTRRTPVSRQWQHLQCTGGPGRTEFSKHCRPSPLSPCTLSPSTLSPREDFAIDQRQPLSNQCLEAVLQRRMSNNIDKVLHKTSDTGKEVVALQRRIVRMEAFLEDAARPHAIIDRLGATCQAPTRYWSKAEAVHDRDSATASAAGPAAWQQLTSNVGKVLGASTNAVSDLQVVKEQVARVEIMLAELQEKHCCSEYPVGPSQDLAMRLESRLSAELAERLERSFAQKLEALQHQQSLRFEELMNLCIQNRESELNMRDLFGACQEAVQSMKELNKLQDGKLLVPGIASDMEGVPQRNTLPSAPRLIEERSSSCTVLETSAAPERPHWSGHHTVDIDSLRASLTSQEQSVHRLHSCLQVLYVVLVLLNVVYMAVSLAVGMPLVIRGEDLPDALLAIEHVFTVAFVLQLLARIAVEKQTFLTGIDKAWNMFDAVLVCLQIVQSIVRHYNFSILRTAAFIKIIRIVSVFRSMKDMREFRLMFGEIKWQPIFWGGVKLCIFIFIFALLLTQVVQAGLMEHANANTGISGEVLEYFGSLWLTMGTLFMVITGGAQWHNLIVALDNVVRTDLAECIFVAYVFIMIFAVMNSITALYIDHLLNFSEHSRFVDMSESAIRDRSKLDSLRKLLNEADRNHNGKISYTEFSKVIHGHEAAKVLHSLDVDVHAVKALYRLLEDVDDCGSVDIDEFLRSLAGLHAGSAPQLLLSTLLFRGQSQLQKISIVSKGMEKHFSRFQDTMTRIEEDITQLLTSGRLRRDSDIG
mmetsp:Transcript_81187/g.160985  ORF Transcript_81187/g.160985 Transcript_81187/m.160985 type:complete len:814 (+) Transcript_81187:41-2482(+)